MGIKALTEDDYYQEAEPALRKIFLNDSLHKPSFGDNAEVRKILYEYWPPDAPIVNALSQAASSCGDKGIYLSIITRRVGKSDYILPEHWWIPFEDVPTYLAGNTDIFNFAYQLESAIYSPQGKWGLVNAFERYGILAGVEEFVSLFEQIFPEVDQQVVDLLNFVQDCINVHGQEKIDITWLSPFLKNVYGSITAKSILQKSYLQDYFCIN
ncbi:MAG: hypothetical protein F6K14_13675 [Symploca sp. SIO2C1]|nr:hypothetical protein [Symploca sp. SIO2C1]